MQPIHAYIAFAFAIPWAIWILMDLLGLYGSKAYMAATAILMFMPMLSALIVHRIFRIPAIRVSWKPKIRKNAREYLAAWLFPPTLSAAGSALYFALFPEDFSIASFQMAAESLGLTDAAFFSMMLAAMLSGAFINMLFALGEEAGWRGFLCPMLSERTGEAKAYIITGVIWGSGTLQSTSWDTTMAWDILATLSWESPRCASSVPRSGPGFHSLPERANPYGPLPSSMEA